MQQHHHQDDGKANQGQPLLQVVVDPARQHDAEHAPNEHVLMPVVHEALQIMTGLFWDIGAEADS